MERLRKYPQAVESVRAPCRHAADLDTALRHRGDGISSFLYSQAAKVIFEDARRALEDYKTTFPENVGALQSARRMLRAVPDQFVPIDPNI